MAFSADSKAESSLSRMVSESCVVLRSSSSLIRCPGLALSTVGQTPAAAITGCGRPRAVSCTAAPAGVGTRKAPRQAEGQGQARSVPSKPSGRAGLAVTNTGLVSSMCTRLWDVPWARVCRRNVNALQVQDRLLKNVCRERIARSNAYMFPMYVQARASVSVKAPQGTHENVQLQKLVAFQRSVLP